MIDALYNGISGLNVNQSALDTQTNNISNVNTVAYKADNISFADMMYDNSIGKGSTISTVNKDFTQGSLKATNNSLDMAINGRGYFIVKGDGNELNYTRAGNFRMSSEGTLQMPNGYDVQGIATSQNEIKSNSADTIFTKEYSNFVGSKVITDQSNEKIETINAKSTDYKASATDDDIALSGNNYKTKESKISDVEKILSTYRTELSNYSLDNTNSVAPTFQESTVSYNKDLLINEYSSISININNVKIEQEFTNNATDTLNLLSDKISAVDGMTSSVDQNGVLTIKSLIPGENAVIKDAKVTQSSEDVQLFTINTTDAIVGSGKARLDSLENQVENLLTEADAKYLRITNTIDSSNPESKTLGDIQMDLSKLNLSDNPFGEIEVDNGVVYVKQNDSRFAVGKVMISSFISEEGLIPIGGNMYSKSAQSGEPIFVNDVSTIDNKMLELSNASLADGLVDLMVYQRAFEANSKSITTSDEFLKTAIQLKK
jgi:flagellar hook protein FlgE